MRFQNPKIAAFTTEQNETRQKGAFFAGEFQYQSAHSYICQSEDNARKVDRIRSCLCISLSKKRYWSQNSGKYCSERRGRQSEVQKLSQLLRRRNANQRADVWPCDAIQLNLLKRECPIESSCTTAFHSGIPVLRKKAKKNRWEHERPSFTMMILSQ